VNLISDFRLQILIQQIVGVFRGARQKILMLCRITSRAEIFSEISFVKTQAPLEPQRSNRQLRYIPTIVSQRT
jgi:hypothetical protein